MLENAVLETNFESTFGIKPIMLVCGFIPYNEHK